MRAAGIDIGSRTIELVVLEDGGIVSSSRIDTTHNLEDECRVLLEGIDFDRLIATGYGRNLAEIRFDVPSVTEIKAYAQGARAIFPECRTVLDIGGQDTKALALGEQGRVVKFEMNDRCAAGTGKFLEIMAHALNYDLDRFGDAALAGSDGIRLSSMCTVFAESEVVGLLTRGKKREDIARGVHGSIVSRTVGLLKRVSLEPPIVFAGGVARNPGVRFLLERELSMPLNVPKDPQSIGALGAALIAAKANLK